MSDKYCDEEEENGRVETLVKTIDRVELLEKQLAIATKALEEYADRENWYNIYDQDTLDACPLSWADRWKKRIWLQTGTESFGENKKCSIQIAIIRHRE